MRVTLHILKAARSYCADTLFAAGFVALALIRYGYSPEIGNNSISLARLASVTNPFLAGDFSVHASRFYHPNFHAALIRLCRGGDPPSVFFTLYLLSLFILCAGILYFVRSYFDRPVSYLTALVLLAWDSHGLEINSLWHNHNLDPGTLALTAALFAFGLLLRHKPVAAALVSGLCIVIHLQIGFIAALILAVFALLFERGKNAWPAATWIHFFLVLALMAVPVLIQHRPVLSAALPAEEFLRLSLIRMPWHHHVDYRQLKLFILLAGLVFLFWRQEKRDARAPIHRAIGLLFILAVLFSAHVLDVQLWKTGLIAGWQFMRVSPIFHLIGVSFLCALAVRLIGRDISIWRTNFIFFIIFIYGLLAQARGASPIPLAMVISFAWLFYMSTDNPSRHFWALGLPLLTMTLFFSFYDVSEGRFARHRPVINIDPGKTIDLPWEDVCGMIRRNVHPGSMVLSPPYMDGFVHLAQRRHVVELKMWPQASRDSLEWEKRIQEVTGGRGMRGGKLRDAFELTRQDYLSLSTEQVLQIAAKYGVSYVVTENQHKLDLLKKYSNPRFAIYEMISPPPSVALADVSPDH